MKNSIKKASHKSVFITTILGQDSQNLLHKILKIFVTLRLKI
jgi:hypothetical protein